MILEKSVLDYIQSKANKEFDPYYLYNSEKIKEKCQLFLQIPYPNKSIHFATMANINHQFLNLIKENGLNVFVNSHLHLDAVQNVGFREKEIIFTSSAMSVNTMKIVDRSNARVNLDSPKQLKQWKELFPSKKVGIRCNIGDKVKPYSNHAGSFIGKESRLGFTWDEIQSIEDKSFINGLHLYVGTDVFDINYFIECYNELIRFSDIFPNLEYLNFGGGFGVSEDGKTQFDIKTYGEKVSELMGKVSKNRNKNIQLILEPGRIIGGNSGYFICFVTDTKKRKDRDLVGVNASTVQFSRPLLYPDSANHPVVVIRKGKQVLSVEKRTTTIHGCSTYSRDIFSDKILLPEIKIGDIIVFGNSGSYCGSSYMNFLGFEKPQEYFI